MDQQSTYAFDPANVFLIAFPPYKKWTIRLFQVYAIYQAWIKAKCRSCVLGNVQLREALSFSQQRRLDLKLVGKQNLIVYIRLSIHLLKGHKHGPVCQYSRGYCRRSILRWFGNKFYFKRELQSFVGQCINFSKLLQFCLPVSQSVFKQIHKLLVISMHVNTEQIGQNPYHTTFSLNCLRLKLFSENISECNDIHVKIWQNNIVCINKFFMLDRKIVQSTVINSKLKNDTSSYLLKLFRT